MPERGFAAWLRHAWGRLGETAHLMVGLPDYRRYVAHRLAHHADAPVMTETEFVRERTLRRYDGSGPGRCC
jgi:uncharacterized short protein YbdD (DUF466 family)